MEQRKRPRLERPRRPRVILDASSDIDRALGSDSSDCSSLFSSDGQSEYNPSDDSNEGTDSSSEVSENDGLPPNLVEDVDFTLGEDLNMSESDRPNDNFEYLLDYRPTGNDESDPDDPTVQLPNPGEDIDFIVGLDRESPLICNSNIEFVQDIDENNDVSSDPNVQFIVDSIHNKYDQTQGQWKNTSNLPKIHDFVGQEKVHIENTNPLEIFGAIFDNELIDKICFWVNKRANSVRGNPVPRHSNLNNWSPVDSEELKKFLGLCMLMGNLNFPSIRHFWSTSPLYEHPIFKKTMSRNRFQAILQCLCFYDSDTDVTEHKLHKIDNVLNHVLANFVKVFSPGKNLSLDEAMILWRGRLSFRQYIKNKRHKYGIKLYELCTHNGFILNILVYTGKGTIIDEDRGHTYEVVMRLMEKYLEKGHSLFLDNFYNSVALAEGLMEKQTNMCGTLQPNREGNPAAVIQQKLKKGESVSRQKGDITVMKWRDKRNVLTISTTNGPEFEVVTNRRGNQVNKPSMVVAYNKSMSGIDRSDQMISYYSTPRKSLRWYVKVFFHLLDACLWNGKFIYSKVCPNSKMTYLQFRDTVIESFIQVLPTPRPGPSRRPSVQQHLPQKLEKRVRCHNCRLTEKKRKTTFYVCSDCKDDDNKSFGLCMPDCFKVWHKR